MFLLVVLGWVLFRAETWTMALSLLGTMFSWTVAPAVPGLPGLLLGTAVAAVIAHAGRNSWQLEHRWSAAAGVGLATLFALSLLVITAGQRTPFLYFQF